MDQAEALVIESFILPLLDFDPKTRWTAQEALSHPWVATTLPPAECQRILDEWRTVQEERVPSVSPVQVTEEPEMTMEELLTSLSAMEPDQVAQVLASLGLGAEEDDDDEEEEEEEEEAPAYVEEVD